MRHDADVDRILNCWWCIRRVAPWTGHSAAMEDHRYRRYVLFDCLHDVLDLLAGGHIASVGERLTPVDPDLLDGRLISDRIHIDADDNRPQVAKLNGDCLTYSSTCTDNLVKGQLCSFISHRF